MQNSEAALRIRTLIEGCPVPDEAGSAEDEIADLLRADGWEVARQVYVAERGDGRGGRVDLVVERDAATVAIEIDRRTPRRKSVVKLRARSWGRVIALRDPDPGFDLPIPEDLQVARLKPVAFTGWSDGI